MHPKTNTAPSKFCCVSIIYLDFRSFVSHRTMVLQWATITTHKLLVHLIELYYEGQSIKFHQFYQYSLLINVYLCAKVNSQIGWNCNFWPFLPPLYMLQQPKIELNLLLLLGAVFHFFVNDKGEAGSWHGERKVQKCDFCNWRTWRDDLWHVHLKI